MEEDEEEVLGYLDKVLEEEDDEEEEVFEYGDGEQVPTTPPAPRHFKVRTAPAASETRGQ